MYLLTPIFLFISFSYANYEIFTQRYSADPAPLVYNNRVYIYTSHDIKDQHAWYMKDYNCFSSDDLVNWRDEGIVFSVENSSWGNVYAWAQQVVALRNGSFVMYYPAVPKGVGVAISPSSPAGPFHQVLDSPLAPGDDPTIFIDDDGTIILCSNNGGPFCGILEENMITWKTKQKLVEGLPHWFEAPWLTKANGVYYMSYMMTDGDCPGGTTSPSCSWSHYGYDIGYGISHTSPLSGYQWMGTMQWNPPYDCGPGDASKCQTNGGDNNHQGMFEFPVGSGNWYLAYHNRKLAVERGEYLGFQRNVALDRLYFNPKDKSILPITSTPNWLRPLHYLNPYLQTPAFTVAAVSNGIDTQPCTDTPTPGAQRFNLGNIQNNSWTHISFVDFGPENLVAAHSVDFRIATPLSNTVIQIFLKSPSIKSGGQLVVTCPIPNTGNWEIWSTTSCALPHPLVGVQELFFVFSCATCTTAVLNFAWWQFSGGVPSRDVPPAREVSVAFSPAVNQSIFVSAEGDGILKVKANSVGDYEKFLLVDNEDGSWGIKLPVTGMFVAVDLSTPSVPLIANSKVGTLESTKFSLQGTTDGTFSMKSYTNSFWVTIPIGESLSANSVKDPRGLNKDEGRFWVVELM